MNQILVCYDSISFEEEFSDKFYTYEGDFSELINSEAFICWNWPGSGVPWSTWENIGDSNIEFLNRRVSYAYKDIDGREWVLIIDRPDFWICLSDPLNPDIPAFRPAPDPAVWGSEFTPYTGTEQLVLPLMAILVVSLTAVTMILIKVFYKQGGKKNA